MIGGASALKINELILIKRKLDRRLLVTCFPRRWLCSWGWLSCRGLPSRCPSARQCSPAAPCSPHQPLGSRPRCHIFCPPASVLSVLCPRLPGGDLCRKSDPASSFRRSPTWRKILEKGKLKFLVKQLLRAVHLSRWGFRTVWELLFVRPWKEKEVCEPSIKECFAFLFWKIQTSEFCKKLMHRKLFRGSKSFFCIGYYSIRLPMGHSRYRNDKRTIYVYR